MWTAKTVIAALPFVGAILVSADTSRPELRAIAELNDCIQQRFTTTDRLFGYSRIATPMSPHKFLPENVRETEAVKALEQARMEVVVYVAGRRVLQRQTGPNDWSNPRGPLQITSGNGQASSPPSGSDLREESREALLAFIGNRSHEFGSRADGWKMIARPVRAADERCLKCHTKLRVGDPIGVVVYAYRGSHGK